MKKLFSLLIAISLGTTPFISTIGNTNNTNNTKIEKDETFKFEKFKNDEFESLAKENLLSSLSIKNGLLFFEINKINEIFFTSNLFNQISSKNFLNTLNSAFDNGFLIYENGKFNFKEFYQPKIDGVWVESYWYWFGWFKLHFSHEAWTSVKYGLDTASEVGNFAESISIMFPGLGIGAAALNLFLTANATVLDFYDKGDGVWIGFLWGIPDMGWGSN